MFLVTHLEKAERTTTIYEHHPARHHTHPFLVLLMDQDSRSICSTSIGDSNVEVEKGTRQRTEEVTKGATTTGTKEQEAESSKGELSP
jgi:hypothetical protein